MEACASEACVLFLNSGAAANVSLKAPADNIASVHHAAIQAAIQAAIVSAEQQ